MIFFILRYAFSSINFYLWTTAPVTHKFWYCILSFSPSSMFCFIFLETSSFTNGLSESMLFHLWRFCCYCFQVCGPRTYSDFNILNLLRFLWWLGYGLSLNMIGKSLNRAAFCCFGWSVPWMSVRSGWLVLLSGSSISYYLVVLSITERRVLKSPTITVDFSISLSRSLGALSLSADRWNSQHSTCPSLIPSWLKYCSTSYSLLYPTLAPNFTEV